MNDKQSYGIFFLFLSVLFTTTTDNIVSLIGTIMLLALGGFTLLILGSKK